MYAAKAKGRDRYEVFDVDLREQALDRLAIEHALHHAVDHTELRLHFQPIVRLSDGRIDGVEALVRWQHPERGLLAPVHFISIAEEIGMMRPIGRWVLERSCEQLRAWDAAGLPDLYVTVNLSAVELADPALVANARSVIDDTGIDPARVAFEITESVLMDDVDKSLQVLHALRSLGVRLFVDDFGTGYSSLAYLNRFPVDVLKIDQSFLGHSTAGTDNTTLVRAIVNLGHSLSLGVTGEGVETEEQLDLLRTLGCDHAQGFHLARPAPAAELDEVLTRPR
jgi:EAL domain-containing protein (putative c-di-GMP-specific phosphodiesterase class I)